MRLRMPLQKYGLKSFLPGTAPAVAAGALLFAAMLAVLTVASRPVTAVGPTSVSGPITAPTTWTLLNSPYIITGDITVEGGGVLTIEPGVEVRFDAGTQLRVRTGPLLAVGASDQPITFTANATAPSRGYWDGILLDDTSLPSTLSHCVVQYAATGVAGGDTDSHTIQYCTVRHNGNGGDWSSGGGIHFAGDGLTIANNSVYDNELGLQLRKSFGGVLSDNHIYDNDLFGIGFIALGAPGGDNNRVAGNRIHDNGVFGLGFFAQGGYGGGSNNRIVNNQIYNTTPALGYPGDGLYLDLGSNNIVTGNLIYGNTGAGVWARAQTALQFTDNIVRGNGRNGFSYAWPNSAPTVIHSNVLCRNSAFQLQNQWGTSFVAEGNWFGTQTPIAGTHVSGPVDFSPWIVMSITASPNVLPADGISTAILTLTMRDGAGHAVPDGYAVDLSANQGTIIPSHLTLNDGQATATYRAGTTPGGVTVQADDGCAALNLGQVLTLQNALDLAVTKADSGLLVGPDKGYSIVYTITVSNVGQLAASSVVLTDVLPAGSVYDGTNWTCQTGTCRRNVGLLAPSATAQFSLPLRLVKSALDCPVVLTNTVRVADTILKDARPEDNVFTLTTALDLPCLPDLFVVKNDNVGPEPSAFPGWLLDLIDLAPQAPDQRPCVRPGEWITYSIAYGNTGLVTATQGLLTETLPQYTHYVGGGWTCAGSLCTLPLGNLPPGTGGIASFIVEVVALPPQQLILNTVRIGGAEPDLDPSDNISSDETPLCAGVVYLPLVLRQFGRPSWPGVAYVSDVAANPVTNRVYVASPTQNAVFAVNPTGAGSVIATIPVGDHPTGLAVVTTNNMIYSANMLSRSVTAIRGSDHTPLKDIAVGMEPVKVAADSGRARVYVSHHLEIDNGAAAINSLTNEFLYYYTRMHATQGRYGIDVDPAHNKLFIAARDAGLIAIQPADQPDVDPQIFKLDPPRVPYVVAFNPATGHLFVTAADNNVVVVLAPESIQWTQGSWLLWQGRPVFLLDQANAGWIKEIPVGNGAQEGIAVNPRTGFVYVTNAEDDTVSVIQDAADPANIHWLRNIAVGDYPQGVDVNVETNLIYVGNAWSRDLTEINGATHTVVKTIPLY